MDNGDGSFTTESYPYPIHFQPSDGRGIWQPIAVGFKATGRAAEVAESAEAPIRVRIDPHATAAGFLRVDDGQHAIAFALPPPARGAAGGARPTFDERQATFSDLLPGVDLHVFPTATGAKSFLVLDKEPSVPSWSFVLLAGGMATRTLPDGGVLLVDDDGTEVATVPRPYAVDSGNHPERGGGAFQPAEVQVNTAAELTTLTISLDPAWLATATYPVYVDPTVLFTGSATYGDAFVSAAYPTMNFGDYVRPDSPFYHEHWLGKDPSNAANVNEAFMKFDLSPMALGTIDAAVLDVFPYHQYYNAPTATTTWVNRVSTGWTEAALTWNTRPGSSLITTANLVEGTTGTFAVTGTVQSWVNGTYTNHGFKLHENGNNHTFWKRLISAEQGGGNVPHLTVTWHRPTASVPPHNFAASRSLTWTYADPGGHGQSHYEIEVHANSSFTSLLSSSGQVASAAVSWSIPPGVTLASGTEYWWRARVKDGTGWSDWASTSFVWDTIAPSGAIVVNGGAAATNTSTVRVSMTGIDAGTTPVYANDGRSLSNIGTGCVATTCAAWAPPRLGVDRAEGSVALVADTGAGPTWHAATVDAATTLRSTLAMDVKRDNATTTYVGLIGDANDGFRLMLQGNATHLYQLYFSATSTPGSFTFVDIPDQPFTPGVWYRLVITSTGPTYNLWWYPRGVDQPAAPTLRQSGVYLPAPRLQIFQHASASTPATVWLDDLMVTQSGASSPYGSGITGVRFSSDGTAWGPWQGYRDLGIYTLPAGAGTRTAYAQLRDGVGNVSATISDSIGVAFDNFGRQPQHRTETWDLGAGDEAGVNVANGNLTLSHPLVTLPYRGGNALELSLTYNAHDTANAGVGPGWTFSLGRRLTLNADGTATLVDADGARHTFTSPVVAGSVTTYTRPATLYAALVKDTGQANEFTLTYRDQRRDRFDIAGSTARLAVIEDRHANGIALAYDGAGNLATATDPAGRQVTFTWDTAPTPDRMTAIADWAWIDGAGVVQASPTGSPRTYRLFYDVAGNLAGWADPLNTAGSCPTAASHRTCLTDAGGLLTGIAKTQTYTTFGGGVLGTASRVVTTAIAYAGSRVASVTDAANNVTSFAVDGSDRLVVRRPTTVTTYNFQATADPYARNAYVWRRLATLAEIEQRTTWDTTYPIEPASVTDNYGAQANTPARTVSYTYQPGTWGLLAKTVEPLTATTNRWTEHTYNANNDVTQTVVSQDGSGTLRTVTRYCYDSTASCPSANGLDLLAQVDNYADGVGGTSDIDVRTDYAYDAHGQRTRAIRHNRDTAGGVLDDREDRFTYEANGNLGTEIINYADGVVTATADDIDPNPATLARTDLTTTHAYDTAGNRISTADPRRAIAGVTSSPGPDDFVTRWSYDALNQQLSERTPSTPGLTVQQKTRSSAYDELGHARSTTDFGGLTTGTERDALGRSTRTFVPPAVTSGSWAVTLTSYDGDGRPTIVKDARQYADSALGSTTSTYDGLGRLDVSTDAAGTAAEAATTSTYDGLDRRTDYDVGGQVTAYTHDLGGRVTGTDDGFACTTEAFDYRDLATSTVRGKDGNGCGGTGNAPITHTYDGLGRLTRDQQGTLRSIDDTFDAAGNRLRSAPITATQTGSETIVTDLDLNLLDQVVTETRTAASISRVSKTTYDAAGNATDHCRWDAGATVGTCLAVGTTPWTNPPAAATSTSYDARNQRISVTDAATSQTTTYDPDHDYRPAAVYTPLGAGVELQTLNTYDARHRLLGVLTQRCVVSTGHACTSTTSLGTSAYAYDGNDNVTSVSEARDGGTAVQRSYCYDPRNQLQYRNTGAACSAAAKDETYTFDAAGNRLSAVTGAGSQAWTYSPDGQVTGYDHDPAGRLTIWPFFEGSLRAIAYDAEGRLTETCDSACSSGSTRFFFTYDADGRRTQIVESDAGGGTSTELRYLDGRISAEYVDGTLERSYLTDEAGSVIGVTLHGGPDAGQLPGDLEWPRRCAQPARGLGHHARRRQQLRVRQLGHPDDPPAPRLRRPRLPLPVRRARGGAVGCRPRPAPDGRPPLQPGPRPLPAARPAGAGGEPVRLRRQQPAHRHRPEWDVQSEARQGRWRPGWTERRARRQQRRRGSHYTEPAHHIPKRHLARNVRPDRHPTRASRGFREFQLGKQHEGPDLVRWNGRHGPDSIRSE